MWVEMRMGVGMLGDGARERNEDGDGLGLGLRIGRDWLNINRP
jgi:hypothetical protein